MPDLVRPHGGRGLQPRLLEGAQAAQEAKRAQSLPKLR